MTMTGCELRVSKSSPSDSSASDAALIKLSELIKLRDIVGKSSRSIVSTTTDATCVATDVSECGDGDHDDNSVVVVETCESSDEDELAFHDSFRCMCHNGSQENAADKSRNQTPSVQIVDLLTGDSIAKSSNSVESDFADDNIKKPRSVPSMFKPGMQMKKDNANDVDLLDGKGSNIDVSMSKVQEPSAKHPQHMVKCVEIPATHRHAKRKSMVRKWQSAPELGPRRNIDDLYVPPPPPAGTVRKKKRKKKKKRERKTAAGAVGGMVAGGFILGPVGVVLGAAVGGFCTRQASKKAEKRKQRKREQQSFRDYATSKALQWELNDAAVFV